MNSSKKKVVLLPGAVIAVSLFCFCACKQNAPNASTLLESPANPGTPVSVLLAGAQNDELVIRSKNTIVAVTAAEISFVASAQPLAPTTTMTEIGALNFERVEFQAASATGNGPCVKEFRTASDANCIFPALEAASPQPVPALQPLAEAAVTDFQSVATPHDGMKCGGHYQDGPIWQKSFDVGIAGNTAVLNQVAHVVYDVFPAYTGNPFDVVANTVSAAGNSAAAPAFSTSVGFLTPVTSWKTTGATVYLKSGQSLKLPGAKVTWSDDDAARKAGTVCAP